MKDKEQKEAEEKNVKEDKQRLRSSQRMWRQSWRRRLRREKRRRRIN